MRSPKNHIRLKLCALLKIHGEAVSLSMARAFRDFLPIRQTSPPGTTYLTLSLSLFRIRTVGIDFSGIGEINGRHCSEWTKDDLLPGYRH